MFLKLESARKNEKDEENIPLTSNRSTIHSGREQFPPPAGRNLYTPPLIVKTPDEDYRKQFNSTSAKDGTDIGYLMRSPKRQNGGPSNRNHRTRDHVDAVNFRRRNKQNQRSVQNKRSVIEEPFRRHNYKSPAPLDEARISVKQRTLEERGEIEGHDLLTGNRGASMGMLDSDGNSSDNGETTLRKKKNTYIKSKELITYFAQLARSKNPTDAIDLKMVDRLIRNGANLNVTDKYGQTVMHEVAKNWHTDVAKYLIKRGAIYDAKDRYGRTPLHLASAVGHVEMIDFLVGQDHEKLKDVTKDERQTALHYAAKNNSVGALKVLLKLGASMNDRDYRLRTALHLAAENGRIEAARYLLSKNAPSAVYDDQGVSCLSIMVQKMPGVAFLALQQFYAEDPANRKLYCYLNYLEKKLLADEELQISWKYLTKMERERQKRELSLNEMVTKKQIKKGELAKSVLEKVVEHWEVSLVVHPAIQLLIKKKWMLIGRKASIFSLVLNVIYALLWSAVGVATPVMGPTIYRPFSLWWHITVLEVIGVGLTIYFMATHIVEIQIDKRRDNAYGKWVIAQAERDLKYCHPRWPEERRHIDDTIEAIGNRKRKRYFSDGWNCFDWFVYLLVWVVMATRLLNLLLEDDKLKYYHMRIFSLTLIFIWLRLLRRLKPFPYFGPFIIMLGYVVIDTIKFLVLFLLIYIPYCCAFWMIFGGPQLRHSKSFLHEINDMVYDIFQMSLVGEFKWKEFVEIDETFAQLLTGSYMGLTSVVAISLYIALLATTFSRKYPQSVAMALIMQAERCVQVERMIPKKTHLNMKAFFHEDCAPLVEEMKGESISIATNNATLSKLDFSRWRGRHENEIDEVRYSMRELNKKQDRLVHQFRFILDNLDDDDDMVSEI
ncbi:transient receptor potential cation channel subfamily A member 1-like [Clytia hemisphaerica]|uniref:Ion transport domain-containing protein n=1 Tax=Clytia hemisphaerica TaxID=252671 RepID=A0A7M5UPC0_9CNID